MTCSLSSIGAQVAQASPCVWLTFFTPVQTAMRRHPNNIEVQREACGAIRTLTSDNAMNKRIAGQIELLAELQSAMSLHIANPEILKVRMSCVRMCSVRVDAGFCC